MSVQNRSCAAGKRRTDIVEGAAVSASLLCLVHCLALPVLLLLLPGALGLFVQSPAFHFAAMGMVGPVALAAFWLGYRRHGARWPVLLGLAGVASLALALMPGMGHGGEVSLTVTGSLLLIVGHAMNWRLRTGASCQRLRHQAH
ncbi:MerC domain-containing protein [Novosphingobium sp. KN65.2]|uniref:MerC domain-containing protein n=1 Tax=Novosphingobium sp. KN65.2 TaxID=1478134 RepID=UPI0005EA0BA7|nr:MerC domain-containing protein [Novosphingobium sp. KN65.2]CDO35532.1 membrane hypothetical protein [Novosphingobium sp. KN65.2]